VLKFETELRILKEKYMYHGEEKGVNFRDLSG
jgi:hypothetical protein